ncbi:MAG: hypothetical protein ABIH41_02675 [Nanoarchaeota archaeon]
MGLSNKKEEQLRKMPRIESKVRKSKDGRWLITQTVITNIKPVQYYKKVLESDTHLPVEEENFDDSGFFMKEGEQIAS